MEESYQPELCREARAVEEGPYFHCQSVVVYFRTTVLGGDIGACWFHDVIKLFQHGLPEVFTMGEFAALIGPNDALSKAKFLHECA